MAHYLVTGGAGYVGSHVVLTLLDRGAGVVVFDDLSKGHAAAVPPGAEFVRGDLADAAQLRRVFAAHRFDAVLHFAALSLVGESMREPLRYIRDNVANTLLLAEEAIRADCRRFVLSSTAAVFGLPRQVPMDEDHALGPVSPYGESKLMAERGLEWAVTQHELRFASLRYFNAAGADLRGRAGEDHRPETHLIPNAVDAALGHGPPLTVFGTDYDTPDGTAIRDYVHVTDLADAHLRVLERLGEVRSLRYNVGSGTGHSVREVIAAVERATGRPVPWTAGPRRPGDPPRLVAANERLRRETGWVPHHGSLDEIVGSAVRWRAAHPRGYEDGTLALAG